MTTRPDTEGASASQAHETITSICLECLNETAVGFRRDFQKGFDPEFGEVRSWTFEGKCPCGWSGSYEDADK